MQDNYYHIALEYHKAGLKIIPVYGEAEFAADWKKYREKQTIEDVKRLFSKPCEKIALLCTDGIEAIDIDTKHDAQKTIANDYVEYVRKYIEGDAVLKKSVIIKTKSDGVHIIYRADNIQGNQKLAHKQGKEVIETRGIGGLLFIEPSPGYQILLGDYKDIPKISDKERDLLIRCAKELDERDQPSEEKIAKKYGKGLTPWDDFNNQTDVLDLMIDAGWNVNRQVGDFIRISKPDASRKADTHGTVNVPNNYFYPFTSESEFNPNSGYSPYAVYTVLHHSGNYKESTKALLNLGYGKQFSKEEKEEHKKGKIKSKLLPGVTKFSIHEPFEELDFCFWFHHPDDKQDYNIGALGMIGAIVGKQKSRKTTLISAMIAAALSNKEVLGWNFDLQGKKILNIDTEQPKHWFQVQNRRMYSMAGLDDDPDNYVAINLRKNNKEERIAIIDHYVKTTPNLGLVVIDGIVDICHDFNDNKAAAETIQHLMTWTDISGALFLPVLHLTKMNGFMRGHLGSELQNKCDFAIETEKNIERKEFSNVISRESRTLDFPNWEFTQTKKGLPIFNWNENVWSQNGDHVNIINYGGGTPF